jgi:hypothetical protein
MNAVVEDGHRWAADKLVWRYHAQANEGSLLGSHMIKHKKRERILKNKMFKISALRKRVVHAG